MKKTRRINDHITMLVLDSREEWLKARGQRVGGSEAAAVLGMNPYMSNTDLWRIKTGQRAAEDISTKPFVKYGHDAEPLLRELFKLDFPELEVGYVENNLFVNSRYPWAHASLDGWLRDREGRIGILEIKTYLQVLHYLMVMEADFAVLKAQLKYDFYGDIFLQTRHYWLERSDIEEDLRILEAHEREFWNHTQKGTQPATILPEI